MRFLPPEPATSTLKGIGACAAVYFAATPFSGWITAAGLPVLLQTGVALAVLTVLGEAYWPVVLAAAWLSAIAVGYHPAMAALFALVGLLEVLAGVVMLEGLGNPRNRFTRFARFALIPLATPLIGATLLAATGPSADFSMVWKASWVKDATGLLLLSPVWISLRHETRAAHRVTQSVLESLLNLRNAIGPVQSSPGIAMAANQEDKVHQTK